jgi:hypothetical protein
LIYVSTNVLTQNPKQSLHTGALKTYSGIDFDFG